MRGRTVSAKFRLWLGVLLALTWASAAIAQQPISSLDELKVLQKTDSKVTVTDTNGQEFRGTIAETSASALSIRIGAAIRQFKAGEIRTIRVRKEDSLTNGALIGAGVSGGLASLAFLDNECRDDPTCYGFVAVYTGFGALIGLGVDALIHRNIVVYTAPPAGGQTTVTVAPLVTRGRAGVQLKVAF